MRRLEELDALRGLLLVWITFTHLPTVLSAYVNQPFGFVSAAEGFIFLSALFTGRICYSLTQSSGYGAMQHKLRERAFRLYLYHAFLLIFVFLVAVPIAASGTRPGLHNLLDFYFNAGPHHAIVDAALLVYRPPLLDILPMYISFLGLTSLVLRLSRKIHWSFLLSGGLTLWLLAQFGVRQEVWRFTHHHLGVNIPLNEMGAFDLWAWQFLWLVGIWMGVLWAKDQLHLTRVARALTIPAFVVFSTLLILRYAVFGGFQFGNYEICFDKWHLGVVRLLDFGAVVVLLIRARSYLKPFSIRPLVLLGKSSLQVFCTHLFFCFASLTLLGNASMLKPWEQLGISTVTLLAMWCAAKASQHGRLARRRNYPAQDFVPPCSGLICAPLLRVICSKPAAISTGLSCGAQCDQTKDGSITLSRLPLIIQFRLISERILSMSTNDLRTQSGNKCHEQLGNSCSKAFASSLLALFFLLTVYPQSLFAQAQPGPSQDSSGVSYLEQTPEQLQQLVAPIALYPDSLAAQLLAASTFPDQVVEADRWVQSHPDLKGEDLAQAVDQMPWDPSIKALTAFPSVLGNMDKNLSWTSSLGDAYYNQEQGVIDAIQVMRRRAQEAGNLSSTPQQTVTTEDSDIDIEPAGPDIVYVPAYDPWVVYGGTIVAWPGWYILARQGKNAVLTEMNTSLLLESGEITATGLRRAADGWLIASWALSWPEQQAAGVEPIALQAYFGGSFHHPHLRGTTVHDWPLNVFSDEDAAAQLSILRAIASSDLHNLVYRAAYRIVPAVNRTPSS